jgi:hypothetical protein
VGKFLAVLCKVLQNRSYATLLVGAQQLEQRRGLLGAFCLQIPQDLVEGTLVLLEFLDGQLLLSGEQL